MLGSFQIFLRNLGLAFLVSGLPIYSIQDQICFLFHEDLEDEERLFDHFDNELTDQDPLFFFLYCFNQIWFDIAMKDSAILSFLFFFRFQGTDIIPIDLL